MVMSATGLAIAWFPSDVLAESPFDAAMFGQLEVSPTWSAGHLRLDLADAEPVIFVPLADNADLPRELQYVVLEQSQAEGLGLNSAAFKAGTTSWQGKSKFGTVKFDGKFDSSAHLTKGKASLSTPAVLGSINLAVDLNNQIKPIKTVTGWQANTPLGSLIVKGNFNEEIVFTGGNAIWNAQTRLGKVSVNGNFDRETNFTGVNTAWNARTRLGTVVIKGNFDRETNFSGGHAAWNAKSQIATFAVKGNFDRETNFTGGNVQVGSKAIIGTFKAQIKLDSDSHFNGADAAWDANLLFGSNIGVSGNFDRDNTFTGGSIKLGAKSVLGLVGVKANLDRETHFTSGSAFWKAQTRLGSINLDAKLQQDGNFSSKLGMEFPL